MWPDWATLKILGDKNSNKNGQKDVQLLGYFVKPHSYVKTVLATIWAFLETFGLLFTATSGHTDRE